MNTSMMTAAESLNTAVAGVLGRMMTGILATMVVAGLLSALGLAPVLFSGVLGWILVFAPLAISLYLAWRGDTMTVRSIQTWYFVFAGTMGVSLSLLFHVFTSASIVMALVGTTVSFGALAGWGYFTKRDISNWGAFLFAGVIGLVVAGLLNIWLESSALQMTLNALTILIFLGLTAYDMNRIRDMFWTASASEIERMQWFGALSLYINFINIFVSMLQLFGNRE
jgi:FtsH-binding integral membrane protein